MSNKKFNNNVRKPEAYHELQLSPGEYCNVLVNDFFAVVDGRYDDLRIIVIKDKIPENPTLEQMATVMAACVKKWRTYCAWYNLPGESTKLFTKKVVKRWEENSQQHTCQSIRFEKRKRTRR